MNIFKNISLFLAVIFYAFSYVYPIGILTPFTEQRVENIKLGKKYLIKPLKVKNTGKDKVKVKVEVLKPSLSELKEDYEQISDISWIIIEKTTFTIKSEEWAKTDIFIRIPKNKLYYGKKYQVWLLTQTVSKTGLIQAGLKSRLLFSTARKKGFFKRIFGWILK